jgi:hypothetical protein
VTDAERQARRDSFNWYFAREHRGCIQCGLEDHNPVPGNGCYAYLVELFGSWLDVQQAFQAAKLKAGYQDEGKKNFEIAMKSSYEHGFATAKAEATGDALEARRLLWLRHGHRGLYGDDGEMQCNECGVDFKRDSIEAVVDANRAAMRELGFAAGIEAAAKLMEENAACFGKSGEPHFTWQLEAEARHIRELLKVKS